MAKLIDLFNEREPELYNYVKYPYKEDDDTQPYRYTTLDNAEPMDNTFFEDQSNPVSLSARRDFNRMFQFSKSAQGLVFLGKQTFLQTGNTFAQTRLYNPLNVQIHSVPFVHLTRHIDVKQTIQSIIGGSTTEEYAKLQTENIAEYRRIGVNRTRSKGGVLNLSSPSNNSIGGIKDRIVDTFNDTINGFVSGYKAQFTNPTGGRPEADIQNLKATHYVTLAKRLGDRYYNDGGETYEDKLNNEDTKMLLRIQGQDDTYNYKFTPGPPGTRLSSVDTQITSASQENNSNYLHDVQNYLNRGGGKDIPFLGTGSFSNGTFSARTRYYKDPMQAGSIISDPASPTDVDSIDVIFSVKDSEPVRFRAFLEDLSETVTPTYNENKYIGRYETFYTYNKVIRDVSFKLTLNAFSEQELHHIHRKMSYLTSLAYPEVTNNYLTPNIFKITIGKIFTKQPCILQSLSHNIETDFSWDINEQLPMAFTSNIGIRLLDKNLHSVTDQNIYSVG